MFMELTVKQESGFRKQMVNMDLILTFFPDSDGNAVIRYPDHSILVLQESYDELKSLVHPQDKILEPPAAPAVKESPVETPTPKKRKRASSK